MSATVSIKGKTYSGARSVEIRDGVVIIDGVAQSGDKLSGVVELKISEGTLGKLETDASVSCGPITGNVSAGGGVTCAGSVGGNIRSGGSVAVGGRVAGAITAAGSIALG